MFSEAASSKSSVAEAAFGRVLTAMVTPFDAAGKLDQPGTADLVRWLCRDGWNDGVVVNGTTGESFATSNWEKASMVHAASSVLQGTGKKVVAGVGSGDTAHSIALAEEAAAQYADGLLVVAPYYSRPSQAGLLRHFLAVADSTDLPVMLYDIPKRTGVAISPETLAAASLHPRIVAVKDAKGDLESTSKVIADTGLAYYSGDDALNLPLLSVGAAGFVSVVGHVAAHRLSALLAAYGEGRVRDALEIHRSLLPVYTGAFRAPAAASIKALLNRIGLPAGPVRLPLVDLTAEETALFVQDAETAGLSGALLTAAVQ